MVFSGARSERNVEDCVGLTCRVLIDLMGDFSATGRVRTQYCADISWGGPKMKLGVTHRRILMQNWLATLRRLSFIPQSYFAFG